MSNARREVPGIADVEAEEPELEGEPEGDMSVRMPISVSMTGNAAPELRRGSA